MPGPYDDIIRLPHHVSSCRRRMSRRDRAAQFAPFAALSGFDSEVSEAARLTDGRRETDEDSKIRLDRRIRRLCEFLVNGKTPEVTVTFFRPDERKSGGSYVTATEKVLRIGLHERSDGTYEQRIFFCNGSSVSIDDVYAVEGKFFDVIDGE